MLYRVSTKPDGGKLWWQAHDAIPPDHIAIRRATPAESTVMDLILSCKGDPPLHLGEQIMRMMRETA